MMSLRNFGEILKVGGKKIVEFKNWKQERGQMLAFMGGRKSHEKSPSKRILSSCSSDPRRMAHM